VGGRKLLDATEAGIERRDDTFELRLLEARPVFIIGPPHSGADVLTWALGQHPNILPIDEGGGWLAKFATDLRATYVLGKDGAQLPRMGIREEDFYEIFAGSINEVILRHGHYEGEYAQQVDETTPLLRYRSPADPKRRWVEPDPEYSFRVYDLLELFGRARFIHLVRDVRLAADEVIRLDRATKVSRAVEFAYSEWRRFSEASLRAERAFGSKKVLRVFNADLLADPEACLRRCLGFLDEPFSPDCLEPVEYFKETNEVTTVPGSHYRIAHPSVVEAVKLNEKLFAEPEPEYEPDPELQGELGSRSAVHVGELPLDGPVEQQGRAIGYCEDSWVDGALTAAFLAEDDIQAVTLEGELPALGLVGEATLFLTLDGSEFEETFELGEEISWTVPCSIKGQEPAQLRLRTSRVLSPSEEGLGSDPRDLVIHLRRLTFSS
jgi:hypothetical protein